MAKILYVEDNPANRLLVRQVLEPAGHTLLEASDGPSGIRLAQDGQPDLILMDINIPGLNGYETTTRIKSLPGLAEVPIIALTAKVMAGDRERALTAGCDGYIAKPIDVDRLPRQINEFLSGRREKVTREEENIYLREYNERLVSHLEQKVKELSSANQDLARTDRMKSRFIDMAAHELRTPLTTVRGYLGILTAPGNTFLANADDATLELIDGIVTGVDRLRGIVQDMLDVTRIEAGTLQLRQSPINLAQVYQKIGREFAPVVHKRQQMLTIGDASHVPTIWADGERVIQILRNLVSNAIKYTPDGGQIVCEYRSLAAPPAGPLPGWPGVDELPEGQWAALRVEDTGIGIAREHLTHLFKRFYRVKSEQKIRGTGLGLSIARELVELHDGLIKVDSTLGRGSTFAVYLPLLTKNKAVE